MEKRYQIFVSSTYADLKQERQKVIQTLMEMDCIPSGMELFPAADEEQWEFIKRIIDDCDYYLLIIGGRYGSTTHEGISYTEKEYDYAIDNGLKVIALLHANPDEIPASKTELDPELRERLNEFREKVASNRLVKFWKDANELPGLVALSLQKTIKTYPAIGWVRTDKASSEQLLTEINELRKENEKLKALIAQYSSTSNHEVPNIASLDDEFVVFGTYYSAYKTDQQKWTIKTTWKEIFAIISPYLFNYPNEGYVETILKNNLFAKYRDESESHSIDDQVFQTIRIQLMALNLINVKYSQTTKGGMAMFWSLTPAGEALMYETRTVRKNMPNKANSADAKSRAAD
jgi:hypothetical protein